MKAILVPVDGSNSSLHALGFALRMLKGRADATLHVITVQPPIISGNVKRFISAEVINSYYQEEGQKALAPARALLDKAGVRCEGRIEVGPVARTIVDFAKEHECDSIVMGTRGLGSVAGMIMGSIATKVLNLTDVPVTLVK